MRTDTEGSYAFIVLLPDADDARGLARLLEDVRLPQPRFDSVFMAPPVRGLAFFGDAAQQPAMDAWWATHIGGDAYPVYLLMHEEGLAAWTREVDGTFYVGVPDPAAAKPYVGIARVQAVVATRPFDIATAVMRDFSGGNGRGSILFDDADALRMAALSSTFPIDFETPDPVAMPGTAGADVPPGQAPASSSPRRPALSTTSSPPVEASTPHPFDLLAWGDSAAIATAASGLPVPSRSAEPERRWQRGPGRRALRGLGGILAVTGRRGGGFQPRPDREVAQLLVERGPTIVVMGSRKGGVGKTSFAAAVAIVAGTLLDQLGHKAAIVDANIANPDAWGQMNLREGAATAREVVAALIANREPPLPVHATTPALACYPEAREASEYSRTDIGRFAEYLRRRYTLIVVDMSNRLPDPMAGPEAAAAAFWLEHGDVLILPTTSAKADFNGVLDYLEVQGRPPTIVPYIIPSVKRLRDNQVTQEYLRVIRERVQRIVEIPDEANLVRLAGMEGVPVEQLSPRLRLAYRELTEVVGMMPRVHR